VRRVALISPALRDVRSEVAGTDVHKELTMSHAQPEVTVEERPTSIEDEPRVQDQLRGALERELVATSADGDGAFMFTDT
jgi:hypothetical protein